MSNPPEDLVNKEALLTAFTKSSAVEIITLINHIKTLAPKQKTRIVTQVGQDGFDGLIIASRDKPEVLPAYMELIDSLPSSNQKKIFNHARNYCNNIKNIYYKDWRGITDRGLIKLIRILPKTLQITLFTKDEVLRSFIWLRPQFISEALKLIEPFDVKTREKILKRRAALLELIEKSPEATLAALELTKDFHITVKEEIATQLNRDDDNLVMCVAEHAPRALPTLLRSIIKFNLPIKEKIFTQERALIYIVKYAPSVFLMAWEIIKDFHVTTIQEIFTKTNRDKNLLMFVAEHALHALPDLLQSIKKLTLPIKEKIFMQEGFKLSALMYLVKYAPLIFLEALKLVEAFHAKKIEAIFKYTNVDKENILMYVTRYAPQILPAFLKFLSKLPRALKEAVLSQVAVVPSFFGGPNKDHLTALMYVAKYAPQTFIEVLDLVKTLDPEKQESIIKYVNPNRESVLRCLARPAHFAPQTVPIFLQFISHLPKAREALLNQNALIDIVYNAPDAVPAALKIIGMSLTTAKKCFSDNYALKYIAKYAPQALLEALNLIKTQPKIVRQTLQQLDYEGEGLEFYIVAGGDIKILNTAVAMGFTFNKETKNKAGYGLLEQAALYKKYDMLKTLISEYGLNPNIKAPRTLLYFAEKYVGIEGPQVINLCKNPARLNALYSTYLDSLNPFVVTELNAALSILPTDLISLISGYLLNDPEQEQELEAQKPLKDSVESAFQLRLLLLKPLSNYCEQAASDASAKSDLTDLLTSKKLDPQVLEEALDLLLEKEELSKKLYTRSLIQCRLNTAKITRNPPNLSGEYQKILEDIELELKKQQCFPFLFKVLCVCTAVSAATLILGIIAICMFHPIALIATTIAVATASTLVLGKSAHGFYALGKNEGSQDDDLWDTKPTPAS